MNQEWRNSAFRNLHGRDFLGQLDGCPINGMELEMCDLWASDNGCFDWGIDFQMVLGGRRVSAAILTKTAFAMTRTIVCFAVARMSRL